MKVFVSPSGWVEIHDPKENETHLQSFYNLKKVIEGKGFIVVLLNSGRLETYDHHLNLLGHCVVNNIDKIQAQEEVVVVKKDGASLKFDKFMNSKSNGAMIN